MEDYPRLTPEERDTILKAIIAAATPARWPCFPELNVHGEWTRWTATPNLRVKSPCSVQQPPWAKNPVNREKTSRYVRALQHDTLPSGYIRLLNLEGVVFDEDCNVLEGFELISIPLCTAPDYQALSYCWGDLKLCTGILLANSSNNQRVFRVTEDLATCLYSIIKSDELETPAYLWIDQLCVNQDDTIERNAQVQVMAEIYQRASLVIVWLGQEAEPECWQRCLADCSALAASVIDGINKYTGHLINFSMFNRRWFTRLWVFQEIVLAKDFVMLMGQRAMRSQEVFKIADGTVSWELPHWSHTFVEALLGMTRVTAMFSAKLDFKRYGYIDLLRTLDLLAQGLECKDPRDRVHALLGCAPGVFPSEIVDYGRTVHDVFRDATRMVIAHFGNLEIIGRTERATSDVKNLQCVLNGLPTWTPGWGTSRTLKLSRRDARYQASGGRPHLPKLEANPDALRVQGRIVTTIMAVIVGTPKLFETDNHRSKHWISLPELCRAVRDHTASIERNDVAPHLGQDASSRMMRDVVYTVFCHERLDPSLAKSDADHRAELFYDQIIADYDGRGVLSTISLQQVNALGLSFIDRLDRNMAVLSDGRLALVDDAFAGAGDSIAILHGLSAPCVLRKVEGKKEYTYQGDAFVKGMMLGTAMDWNEDEADTFTLI